MASAKENYRVELRAAARQLGDCCLYSAAKWYAAPRSPRKSKPNPNSPPPTCRAAELLVGIEPDAAPSQSAAMDTPSSSGAGPGGRLLHLHRSGGSSFRRRMRQGGGGGSEAGTPLAGVSYVTTPIPDDDDAFDDKYLLAKTYFDCREYRRAAHVLRGHVGRKAVFLRCYALYMVRRHATAGFADFWGRAGGV
jgi:anaphase-promoting complex subunit 8